MVLPYFRDMGLNGETTKVVSPDAGGVYRAKRFRDGLSKLGVDAGLAMIVKQRTRPNEIGRMDLVGDVQGCDVIMVSTTRTASQRSVESGEARDSTGEGERMVSD